MSQPFGAWWLHGLALWIWHVPVWFQAAAADPWIHSLQHLSFLASALLFWNALIGNHAQASAGSARPSQARMRGGKAVLYLLSTAIHTGVLGALLTFSPYLWFPLYREKTERWGLSALEDQQLGGLIMWVPAGMLFVLAGLFFAAQAIFPAATGWPHVRELRQHMPRALR
jgi:putative membrane protein